MKGYFSNLLIKYLEMKFDKPYEKWDKGDFKRIGWLSLVNSIIFLLGMIIGILIAKD